MHHDSQKVIFSFGPWTFIAFVYAWTNVRISWLIFYKIESTEICFCFGQVEKPPNRKVVKIVMHELFQFQFASGIAQNIHNLKTGKIIVK